MYWIWEKFRRISRNELDDIYIYRQTRSYQLKITSNNVDKISLCMEYGIIHYQQRYSCIFVTTWINISDINRKEHTFYPIQKTLVTNAHYRLLQPYIHAGIDTPTHPAHCGYIIYKFIISCNQILPCKEIIDGTWTSYPDNLVNNGK